MLVKYVRTGSPIAKTERSGTAIMEFAVCLPFLMGLLLGLWEVGRTTEVQNVVWNSAREASRDASMGQSNLLAVANNLLLYLQSAEPTAFGYGHTTSMQTATSLPANTYGYTCMDTTVSPNRELFTITFTDVTTPTVTDPTGMNQLDLYQIGVSVPYASIGWWPVPTITGRTRLYVTMEWASLVDAPFTIASNIPAQ